MGQKSKIRFTLALLEGRKVQLTSSDHERKACRVSIDVTRGTLRFVSYQLLYRCRSRYK